MNLHALFPIPKVPFANLPLLTDEARRAMETAHGLGRGDHRSGTLHEMWEEVFGDESTGPEYMVLARWTCDNSYDGGDRDHPCHEFVIHCYEYDDDSWARERWQDSPTRMSEDQCDAWYVDINHNLTRRGRFDAPA